jgi:hypothetical protein
MKSIGSESGRKLLQLRVLRLGLLQGCDWVFPEGRKVRQSGDDCSREPLSDSGGCLPRNEFETLGVGFFPHVLKPCPPGGALS